MDGVTSKHCTGHNTEHPPVCRLPAGGDVAEQEVEQESVEVVQEDVDDLVVAGLAPVTLVLKPETECC